MGAQPPPAPVSGLSVSRLTVERDHLPIVREASLVAPAGEITVLLGVNGAGKTTLIEGISGATPVASGEITLDGRRIERKRPTARAKLGLAHVEQGRSVFRDLTTEQNFLVAAGDNDVESVFELFPELARRRNSRAGLLSGGEQQMVALGRALVRRPSILLLDELSLGLAPVVVERLFAAVRDLADSGVCVLLVEQFADLALSVGGRAYVLRTGRMVFEGECAELAASPGLLQRLYLGSAEEAA
ncbi:ABC transporter ATP-binding protein [Streptosporangium saharense]|uniref:Branched-chain amino acid transport system ATP-binding protein n=1 Tax=Streptosporangium saharense TaxID=1706840 RepID=A0A7W7QSG5_9ACTN|nr:ATP-binding cassette domain-containing protein [Streptosporangium saharense]MBB4918965.1 branched-chain amino acid transport system ATP-binding protein [Streptosporangium saharense]